MQQKRKTKIEIGQRFGKLVVTAYAPLSTSRELKLVCLCDCGGTKTIFRKNLVIRKNAHCGCERTLQPLLRKPELPQLILKVRSSYESNAKKRGTSYTLTPEQFEALILDNCHYCGAEPSNVKTLRGVELHWNGIDRKENSKGYEIGNVVTCCSECNYMKCERDYDEFLERISKISKNRLTST